MTTPSTLAQAANAVYAVWTDGSEDQVEILEERLLAGSVNSFLSEFHAPKLNGQYVHQAETATGFSATVFASNDGTKPLIFSVEGTDSIADIAADTELALHGYASSQIVDGYIFLKQCSTPAGTPVTFSAAERTALSAIVATAETTGVPASVHIANLLDKLDAVTTTGTGVLSGSVDFVGHSLGGHVAAVLADLAIQFLGSDITVHSAATFNSPGYAWSDTAPLPHVADKLNHYVAEDGISPTAGFGNPSGEVVLVNIEGGVLHENHGIARLADGLAVRDFLTSRGLSAGQASSLLDAASYTESGSINAILGWIAIAAQAAGLGLSSLSGDVFADIAALNAALGGTSLTDLRGLTSSQLASLAADDAGIALALLNLRPLAISTPGVSPEEARSHAYWTVRADFMRLTAEAKARDFTWQTLPGELYPSVATFLDDASGGTVSVGGGTNRSLTYFADDGGTTIAGWGVADRLFGGQGDDVLAGGAGNDYLEGAGGNDTLDGGTGADAMYGGTGNDTYIVDDVGDQTIELADQGYDKAQVHFGALSNGAYVLQGHIEEGALLEDAGAGDLTGNSDANTLFGNSYANTLTGGAGEDSLYGNAGNDVLIGSDDSVRDLLSGGAGFDTYFAGQNDVVIDSDQHGQVHFQGSRVTGGILDTRVSPNGRDAEGSVHYVSLDATTTLVYNAAAARLVVTKNGKSFTVNEFRPTSSYDIDGTASNPGQKATFATSLNIKLVDIPNGNIANDLASAVLVAAGAVSPRQWDPLVLDLNADGVLGTQGNTPGVHFDLDASGFAERTSWVSAQDGLVVRDLDGNGAIDTGRELFGDQTALLDGGLAAHGFAALAALDSNADGKVDASDSAWGELRVWRDADSNGVSEADELLSMSAAGVSAINLTSTSPNTIDANGNILARLGSFTRVDGTTGKAGSFLFSRDVTDSYASSVLAISPEIEALPDLQGFGAMYTLHQAMARDDALTAMVQATVSSTDYRTLLTQFEAVLQRWAGADTVVLGSRGTNVDARQLAVVEKFYGQDFEGTAGANPNTGAGPQLTGAYKKLLDQLYLQFLPQAQLNAIWSKVTFAIEDGAPDFAEALPAMQTLLGAGEPTAAVQLLYEFARSVKAFGLETSAGFAEFKEAFVGSPFSYDKVIQAGLEGRPVLVGSDTAETLSLSSKGLIYGLEGGDLLLGGSYDDTLHGGAGNDTLKGGDGDDTLYGGDGNDILDGGYGADVLYGGAGDDVLGGTDVSERAGSVAARTSSGAGQPGYISLGGNPVQYVNTNIAVGNTYEGGTGNDTLNGTHGADLYLFGLGDGQDTIVERPGVGVDVLRFGEGIAPGDVSVSRSGLDLVLAHVNGADRVTVKDWFASTGYQVERVEFADGTAWAKEDLTAQGLVVSGTAEADTLTGVLSFANVLYGLEGNDTLNGGAAGDLLFGGEGNDFLNGAGGSDTYKYFAGEGYDTVTDTAGTEDTLDFGAIEQDTAAFYQVGNDLEVLLGPGQGVLVKNQFTTGGSIEFFLFGGQSYSAGQINALAGAKP